MKTRLLLIGLLVSAIANAQTITGKLADLIDNKPLAGASLELRSVKDSTNRFGALADSAGRFRFNNIPNDSFTLQVSFIGYAPYRQYVSINDSIPNVELGTLFIPKTTRELSGVTVTAKTPPAQQKGDTTQYHAR